MDNYYRTGNFCGYEIFVIFMVVSICENKIVNLISLNFTL